MIGRLESMQQSACQYLTVLLANFYTLIWMRDDFSHTITYNCSWLLIISAYTITSAHFPFLLNLLAPFFNRLVGNGSAFICACYVGFSMSNFVGPVLPRNQILYLHHFNLKSLYLQPPQSLPNWIQFHVLETSPAVSTPFQSIGNKYTFFCYSLLSGQFQLKLFYCGNVTLCPCECSLQHPLILRWTESFTPIFFYRLV